MVQLPILDETLYNLQRQGRISFYVSPQSVSQRDYLPDIQTPQITSVSIS